MSDLNCRVCFELRVRSDFGVDVELGAPDVDDARGKVDGGVFLTEQSYEGRLQLDVVAERPPESIATREHPTASDAFHLCTVMAPGKFGSVEFGTREVLNGHLAGSNCRKTD